MKNYASKQGEKRGSDVKVILYFLSIVFIVVLCSFISVGIWGGKQEQPIEIQEISISDGMTIREFGEINSLTNPVLREIFDLKSPADLDKNLDEYGNIEHITALVRKNLALASEHATKNWTKIPVKFVLWFVFLIMVFIVLRNQSNTSVLRKWLYLLSILIFGVIMGSDPSPMGTVKDAIHLYGTTQAVYIPRMIALGIFLTIVFIANKYICAWGCQAGTLQDLIFRVNRTKNFRAAIGRQVKLPFVLTNTIRFVFFCIFTFAAVLWGAEIIEPIDPFKIYNPAHVGLLGGVFIGVLLVSSLFIYRPWCHLFCPFGLVGWIIEKVSFVKISVDYDSCIACEKCSAACPSTVMDAILKRDTKTIPDCFACYTCRDVCPTDSIRFSSRKRTMPPADKFKK